MKYVKKPIVVEAFQFDGSFDKWPQWAKDKLDHDTGFGTIVRRGICPSPDGKVLSIPTLEGPMMAVENDWIIKGIKGELYPCKADIFEATYDQHQGEER